MTELYPFQSEDVRRAWRDYDLRVLFAHEMGLGKTIISLTAVRKYLTNVPGPVVVVCPAHLKIHWQREANKHLGLRVELLSKQLVPTDRRPPADPDTIFVINYDVLDQPRRDGRRREEDRSWCRWLNDLGPKCVIADECHYVKDRRALRSRALRRLCRGVPHLIFLSGTPLVNRPPELFNALNMLRPDLFNSFFDFASRYSHATHTRWGWQFYGGQNLAELHALLSRHVLIRRLKRDVLPELPRKTVTVVPFELDAAGRREYDEAASEFLLWLEKISPTLARRAARAEALTRLGYLRRLAARLKLPQVVEWVRDFLESSGGKLLVGAVHKSVVRPLAEEFGHAAVAVDGELDPRDKQVAFDRFNGDPACSLLVGNIQAAGTGWSCRSTSDVAMAELPWTPGDLSQFLDRCHGLGRGEEGVAVNAYLLVADDTIEEDLCEVLQDKAAVSAAAVDGDEADVSMNLFDELRRMTQSRSERRSARASRH